MYRPLLVQQFSYLLSLESRIVSAMNPDDLLTICVNLDNDSIGLSL